MPSLIREAGGAARKIAFLRASLSAYREIYAGSLPPALRSRRRRQVKSLSGLPIPNKPFDC